jgi:hypothetical protein
MTEEELQLPPRVHHAPFDWAAATSSGIKLMKGSILGNRKPSLKKVGDRWNFKIMNNVGYNDCRNK